MSTGQSPAIQGLFNLPLAIYQSYLIAPESASE